jgi:hypothetical protein
MRATSQCTTSSRAGSPTDWIAPEAINHDHDCWGRHRRHSVELAKPAA